MIKFKHKVPGALSVFELRELGFELTATPETAFGVKTNVIDKDGRVKSKPVFIMPPDFVLDRFNFTTIDISQAEYKKKVH